MTQPRSALDLSIIVPAYNEATRITPTLQQYTAFFRGVYGEAFEVVVVLNGCTDDTRSVVEAVTREEPQVRMLEFSEPLGKGGAIYEGLQVARGARLAFVDADNMVKAPETSKLIHALESSDVAIANRFDLAGSDGGQSLGRRLSSRAVRLWVRLLLGMPFQDTQCGAKALRPDAWQAIAPYVRERGWTFDLDLLAAALSLHLRVAEVPVKWEHVKAGSKVRAFDAGREMLLATLRIRARSRQRARAGLGR